MDPVRVALEVGSKRYFAVALDWPGWSRSGRTEQEALQRLADYAGRYAAAIGDSAPADAAEFEVIERLEGNATTDFGAPGIPPAADERPLGGDELARQRLLLEASWNAFDAAAAAAAGRRLATGPRGGGRDVAKMTDHVLGAEEAYLTQLGRRRPKPPAEGVDARMRQVREAALEALEARARGEDPPDASRVKRRWSPRYFVRRSAWHALDHAWELEDRVG
ncbi:MAG TPA: hypothetical protein VF071_11160 [Candidatus Limnocylindria bacterium]